MPERDQLTPRHQRREQARTLAKQRRRSTSSLGRRNFLLGSTATIALIASGVCVWDSLPSKIPTNPGDIGARLRELDPQVLNNPKIFLSQAPEIGVMAVNFFCQEMTANLGGDSYNPRRVADKIHYFDQAKDYEKILKQAQGCTVEDSKPITESGSVFMGEDDIYIDLPNVLTLPGGNSFRDKMTTPASQLFSTVLHELHHVWPPTLSIEQPIIKRESSTNLQVKLTLKRGLVQAGLVPEKDLPGKKCYISYRTELEETVVQHSAGKMAEKVGYRVGLSSGYEKVINQYQNEIINKLFNKDHLPLLRFHQLTEDVNFLSLIGGHFTSDSAKAEEVGDDLVYQTIVQGQRLQDFKPAG